MRSRRGTVGPDAHTVTLWRRDNGVYYAVVYWKRDAKPERFSLAQKDEDAARRQLEHWKAHEFPYILARRRRGEEKPKDGLHDIAAWYIDKHMPAIGLSPETISRNRRAVSRFVRFAAPMGALDPSMVTSRMVQEWQISLDADVRNHLLCLRKFFSEWARMHGTDPPQIAWNIPPRKPSRRFLPISVDTRERYLWTLALARADVFWPAAWMCETGWLVGDTLDLRWSEIRGDTIDRKRLKTGSDLGWPVTRRMRAILNAQKPDTERVFMHRDGIIWKPKSYRNAHARIMDGTGAIHVRTRDLRETWATAKANAGVNQHDLSELLGHRDPTIAGRYYLHSSAETKRRAAETPTE